MAVFDNDLMFRTTGNLTATTTSGALTLRGTSVHGMAVRILIPSTTGTTNALLAEVQVSNDNSTYKVAATYPGGATSWASGAKEWIIPLVTDRKYAKLKLTVSGSTGTPNFGVVVAGIVEGVGYDWTRSVDWT